MESKGELELNLSLPGNEKKVSFNQNPNSKIIQCVILCKLSNLPLSQSFHLSNGNNPAMPFAAELL